MRMQDNRGDKHVAKGLRDRTHAKRQVTCFRGLEQLCKPAYLEAKLAYFRRLVELGIN